MYTHTSVYGDQRWKHLTGDKGEKGARKRQIHKYMCARGGGRGEMYAVAWVLECFFTLFNSNEFTRYWLLELGEATHLVGWAVFSTLRAFLNDANQSTGAWPLSTISFSVIQMWWEPEIKHVCVCTMNERAETCVLVCQRKPGSKKTELADRADYWSFGVLLVMLRGNVNMI